jgi:hypothetical protein
VFTKGGIMEFVGNDDSSNIVLFFISARMTNDIKDNRALKVTRAQVVGRVGYACVSVYHDDILMT